MDEDYYHGELEENPHCNPTNLTFDQKYSSLGLASVCFVSLIISVPAVLLAIHEYCIKNRLSELRTERLLLYLVFGSGTVAFVGSFQWVAPLSLHSPIANTACVIVGYMWFAVSMYTSMTTLCIGIHFLIQIINPKILSQTSEQRKVIAKRLEIAYISVSLIATFTLTPWPFISNAFGYNLWICWFVTTSENCKIKPVPTTEVTIFYIVALAIALFTIVVMVIVHILICLRGKNFSNLYVWVFTVYLVSVVFNFIVTMVVNFINIDDVPSILNFIKVTTIGFVPLTGSAVTLIAVIYTKKRLKQSRSGHHQNQRYNSITGAKPEVQMNPNHHDISSREPTTKWVPPIADETSHGSDVYFTGWKRNKHKVLREEMRDQEGRSIEKQKLLTQEN